MVDEILRYMESYHMIEPGGRIVAGVSGGADSVCLLVILDELRKVIPFGLEIIHVNHRIRAEASEDAAYVEALCLERGLPFHLVEEDVGAIAAQYHLSAEEAGRKVRYEAFDGVLQKDGQKGRIAVAHNKNDQSETVLFNLFRGSSIKGMCGIAPVRDHIIRPLLSIERSRIEAYLKENKISYCIDRTNAEDTYTRNRIRNHILPYAEEQICSNASAHIADIAENMREAEELLQSLAKEAYGKCVTSYNKTELTIHAAEFEGLRKIIKKYLVMECFTNMSGTRKDLTAVHVEQVCGLLHKGVGKLIHLPYGLCAVRGYEDIRIRKRMPVPEAAETKVYRMIPGRKLSIEGLGEIRTRLLPNAENEIIPEKRYTKWFDYDKIEKSLLLRNRKLGDFFLINGQGGKKTLKDYMIQEKIPREDRGSLFAIADGEHILWLIGYRISQHYKVGRNTKRILEVEIVQKGQG